MKYKCVGAMLGLCLGLLSKGALSADLMSVYQLALENDNILSAASNDNQAVRQAGRQVTGLYYPTLDAGYDRIETDQTINSSENDVFGSGQSKYPTDVLSLSLTQPVFRLDSFRRRKVASASIRQSDFELTAAQQGLMLRSAESYLLTLAALDNQFVSTAERDSMSQQLDQAEKRLEVGLGNPAEVQESIARLEFNQAKLIEAGNAVADREEGLRVITGVEIASLVPLQEAFNMVPPDPENQDEWIARALENNLLILARKAAVETAEAEYAVQKAGHYPTIDLVARYNNRESGGSLFGGGSDVDTTDLVIQGNWSIYQGGIVQAKIREALYKKQTTEDELALVVANVRRETRNAYLGVVSSIAKAKALKLSMDSQENTLKAKVKGFEIGVNSNIEVLDSTRDFYFVQRDYLKVRYDYLISLLDLKRQVGSLSPADLQLINGKLNVANPGVDKSPVQVAQERAIDKNTASTEDAPASRGEPEPVLLEMGGTLIDEPPAPTVLLSAPGKAYVDSYRWLFGQLPGQFTIQVASLESAVEAEGFMQKHGLDDAHYFKSGKPGKDWHYIVSGSFPSHQKAQQASAELGISGGTLIRKIASMQKSRCDASLALSPRLQQICMAGPGVPLNTIAMGKSIPEEKRSAEIQ